MLKLELLGRDSTTLARRGRLTTNHGVIETPVFMPVGTVGTVKGILPWQVEDTGARILLGNTYHLYLRPGMEVMAKLGGLHKFMAWPHSILTDSGGYQVFSLSALRKIEEEGVEFRSHLDGSKHRLTPESVVGIQETIGSDIMMVLDECPAPDAPFDYTRRSLQRTTRWAARSLAARKGPGALFGILQGGVVPELRREHAAELTPLDFDGFSIGGLSVGEPTEVMYEICALSAGLLPDHKPRYLMGVGKPADIINAVSHGVDMFDCVLPTRSGRTGLIFTAKGELVIKQARYRLDESPLDPDCPCPVCRNFSRAYLRHLFVAGEMLGSILNTMHNLYFYQHLMAQIRLAIEEGRYGALMREWLPVVGRRID
jgi:queuine tRNA-ribosyltransferase